MSKLREILYSIPPVLVNNSVTKIISAPILSLTIPPIVGLYYGILDIWGDDWNIISSYKNIHEFIFTILAAFTIIILFVKGISETLKDSITKKREQLSRELLSFFNGLVTKKKNRFHSKAKYLKRNNEFFKIITQPNDQIEHIMDGVKQLLVRGLDINERHISITIIEGNESLNKWWYEFKCDRQRNHTDAETIISEQSTARYCLQSGDSIFIPDIKKGVKENVFFESTRSKQAQEGSIFCKPIKITVGAVEYIYIFTITVLGEYLCNPFDSDASQVVESIFIEISDRVELELYLHSIKQFKEKGGNP